MRPAVTAVIPNWNGGVHLSRTLADLSRQSHPLERIVVIDNGSTDGSADQAASAGAEVVRLASNTGFAHAVNQGWRRSSTPLTAVLNNDVELAPDWLESLAGALLADPEAGFATGKILHAQDRSRIDGTFDLIARSGCAWRCGSGSPDGPIWSNRQRIASAPFTAVLLRTELGDRVGNLDESFGSYLEDVDFGIRCAIAGVEGLYVPEALVWHQGSATLGSWSSETVRLISKNQLRLALKYHLNHSARAAWSVAIGQLLWACLCLRHGHLGACLRGKRDALRDLPRAPATIDERKIRRIFLSQEQQIQHLMRQVGYDWYWKVYFALT